MHSAAVWKSLPLEVVALTEKPLRRFRAVLFGYTLAFLIWDMMCPGQSALLAAQS